MDAGELIRWTEMWGGMDSIPSLHAPAPSKGADLRPIHGALSRVSRELWAAKDAFDLQDRIGYLMDQGLWPSLSPLFDNLLLRLPVAQQNAQTARKLILRRAAHVFGPLLLPTFSRCLDCFSEAVQLSARAEVKEASQAQTPPPWGGENLKDVLFQADFPPTLRRAILENEAASLAAMALVQALLEGQAVNGEVAKLLMDRWVDGKSRFLAVSVGILGDKLGTLQFLSRGIRPPTLEDLVEEGRKAQAAFEQMMSDDDPDLAQIERDVRSGLEAQGLDADDVLRRAAKQVEHLGASKA